jgi:hypothetical protein
MKLRLKENTIRIRLNKDDLNMLQTKAEVISSLQFPNGRSLAYGVVLIDGVVRLDFENDQLTLAAPRQELENWSTSEKVSFSWSIELEKEKGTLEILLEKDFPCLTTRAGEDESNLYPHPNRLARNHIAK